MGAPARCRHWKSTAACCPRWACSRCWGATSMQQEDHPNGPPAVILGHGFWQRRFGGDTAVVGQTMQVEGVPHTIVGVLPAGVRPGGRLRLRCRRRCRAFARRRHQLHRGGAAGAGVSTQALGAQVDTRQHALYTARHRRMGGDYWHRAHFGAQDFSAEAAFGSARDAR